MELDIRLVEQEKVNANVDKVWNKIVEEKSERLMVHLFYNIYMNRMERAFEIAKYLVRTDEKYRSPVPDRIHLSEYLKIASDLISKRLVDGYVYVDDVDDLRARMLVARIKSEIESRKDYYGKVFQDWLPKISVKIGYPPCIDSIIRRIMSGENVGHYERLVLGMYMINIGKNIDEILELYRPLPNFNEKKTRYHLEHIREKGYKMYSCEKIRQLGLCVADCKISNPLRWRGPA